MKLIKVDKPQIRKVYSPLSELIQEFRNSGMQCAKIDGAKQHYSCADSARSAICNAIKRLNLQDVRVTVDNNGEVYLIRKEATDDNRQEE